MAPIRVGFLGLSKSGWAPYSHLPYLQASSNYQIVAICNSSIASSQDAIALYSLPPSTKAYGDPEDLAKDPNVDLVVCSVRVDRHLSTISPSLKAGKDVYVEWPLGASLSEARELLRLKNEHGVKNAVVGLQSRQSPVLKTIKSLIETGKIGEVLSSVWNGQGGQGGPTTSETYEYLGRREVGGNLVTIHAGHAFDCIQFVLGYGFLTPPKSLLANRRHTQQLIDAEGKVLEEKHPKNSEDTIFLHGTLSTGVPLSFSWRRGKPFPGNPGISWTIYGEKGEIRITAPGSLQVGYKDVGIQVWDFNSDEVREVEVEGDEFDDPSALDGKEYPWPARNVGRVYKAFADGEMNCSFEDAVERHVFLESLYKENGIVA